jgi:hypothetical protein
MECATWQRAVFKANLNALGKTLRSSDVFNVQVLRSVAFFQAPQLCEKPNAVLDTDSAVEPALKWVS